MLDFITCTVLTFRLEYKSLSITIPNTSEMSLCPVLLWQMVKAILLRLNKLDLNEFSNEFKCRYCDVTGCNWNIGYPSETHLELKSCETSFVRYIPSVVNSFENLHRARKWYWDDLWSVRKFKAIMVLWNKANEFSQIGNKLWANGTGLNEIKF